MKVVICQSCPLVIPWIYVERLMTLALRDGCSHPITRVIHRGAMNDHACVNTLCSIVSPRAIVSIMLPCQIIKCPARTQSDLLGYLEVRLCFSASPCCAENKTRGCTRRAALPGSSTRIAEVQTPNGSFGCCVPSRRVRLPVPWDAIDNCWCYYTIGMM